MGGTNVLVPRKGSLPTVDCHDAAAAGVLALECDLLTFSFITAPHLTCTQVSWATVAASCLPPPLRPRHPALLGTSRPSLRKRAGARAAIKQHIAFVRMGEEETRRWVEAHPGEVNNKDWCGNTLLHTAIYALKSLELVLWLVHEKGADVNIPDRNGFTPLHFAQSLDVLKKL